MDPIFIVLIALGCAVFFLFLVYLFLIMPSLGRKKRMAEFTSYKYAHRGLHGEGCAENSLTAFRRAVERGYGIELDVQLSRDGYLVVFHDDHLERVTGVKGRVDEYDYADLAEMRLSGTEDKIPLFTEVLSIVDGKVPLIVEIKANMGKYEVVEKTVEVLSGYNGKYVVESFNPLAVKKVKEKDPEILRGILSMNYLSEKKHSIPLCFVLQMLMLNVLCRPDFVAYDHRSHKSVALNLCRAVFGVTTVAWTTRSPEEEKAAYAHEFDTVIFENYLHGENNQ